MDTIIVVAIVNGEHYSDVIVLKNNEQFYSCNHIPYDEVEGKIIEVAEMMETPNIVLKGSESFTSEIFNSLLDKKYNVRKV